MQRSEIRGSLYEVILFPDCASLHPGYLPFVMIAAAAISSRPMQP